MVTVSVWDAWNEKLKDNLYDNVSSGKLEIPRERFMQKMDTIKDRNSMDLEAEEEMVKCTEELYKKKILMIRILTEAEVIKKRWQKYAEELHKKRS